MIHQSDALQQKYQLEIMKFVTKNFIFFDELIFNEKIK